MLLLAYIQNNIHESSNSKLGNFSLKNINQLRKSVENYKINQSNNGPIGNLSNNAIYENNYNLYNVTKSLSFQDEGFMYGSKSTNSDGEFENNFNITNFNIEKNEELSSLLQNLKNYRIESVRIYLEDSNILKLIDEIFKKDDKLINGNERSVIISQKNKTIKNFKNESNNFSELREVINKLILFSSTSINANQISHNSSLDINKETELLISLVKLVSLFNYNSKLSLIDYFIKNFGIVNFISILNSKYISSKSVHILLYIINIIINENVQLVEDFLSYGLLFYVTRLLHSFNDVEIKAELIYMLFLIIINSPGLLRVCKILKISVYFNFII